MLVVDFGDQFDTEIEWIIRLHFLRVVLAGIANFAFMTTNMDAQLDQNVNILLYNVQMYASMIWSCWWCILRSI